MNTVTLNFVGSLEELNALLTTVPFVGRNLECIINVTIDDTPEIIRRLKGRASMIEAVRLYRELTGCSLRESKDFLDRNLPVHWAKDQ